MCEQCLTNPVSFGEPLPGWILMRARRDGNDWMQGEWGLIECNDPTFRWKSSPTPSPTWGMSEEEEDEWDKTVEKGSPEYERASILSLPDDFIDAFETDPRTGYKLIKAAIECGYDPETSGMFSWWFFDYLGEWLKTAEMVEEGDCFPNREEFAPTDYSIGRN